MTERVTAAACRHPDGGVYSLAPPARHGQVLRLVESCYPEDREAVFKVEQGFVTSGNRFVTRTEARKIADHAGQSSDRDMHLPELFSEDLW